MTTLPTFRFVSIPMKAVGLLLVTKFLSATRYMLSLKWSRFSISPALVSTSRTLFTDESAFRMCSTCAKSLTLVYNNYKEFINMIHPQSEVGHVLGRRGQKTILVSDPSLSQSVNVPVSIPRPNVATDHSSDRNPNSLNRQEPCPTIKRKRERPHDQTSISHCKKLRRDLNAGDRVVIKDEPMSDFGEYDDQSLAEKYAPESPFFDYDDDNKVTARRSSARTAKSVANQRLQDSCSKSLLIPCHKLEVKLEQADFSIDILSNNEWPISHDQSNSDADVTSSSDDDFNETCGDEEDSYNSDSASDEDFTPITVSKNSKSTNKSNVASPIESNASFNCPSCPATFAHLKSYQRHYLSTHENVSYSCPHPNCDKLFTREDHVLTILWGC